MGRAGFTPGRLAALLTNEANGGKPICPRRIYSWMGRFSPHTAPSPPLWRQLQVLMPDLAPVEHLGDINSGPAGHELPSVPPRPPTTPAPPALPSRAYRELMVAEFARIDTARQFARMSRTWRNYLGVLEAALTEKPAA
jgi:hypothetical protein